MLVEDNPMDVDLTLRAFRRHRLANEVVVARDGQEVLDALARWDAGALPATLILLDLKLPKVDGLEVLRTLKAHPRWRFIPVVVLTTSADDDDVQRAYALGVNAYIIKPVDFTDFVRAASQVEMHWCLLNHVPEIGGQECGYCT